VLGEAGQATITELSTPYGVPPTPGGVDIDNGLPVARARAFSNSSIVSRALGVGSPTGCGPFV
jgi:hypothetical protein